MDVNPNMNPNMSDKEKIDVLVDRLWSLHDWMIDEYDVTREVVVDGMNIFKEELCDHWNYEDEDD